MEKRFHGKVVIITGAAAGIGAATALRFVDEGAHVALCDINGDLLVETGASLQRSGQVVLLRKLDASDGDALEAFVVEAAKELGSIDVLVNNVGSAAIGNIDKVSPDDWDHIIRLNLNSVYRASRAALPYLRTSKGNIVNVGSISGLFADWHMASYNATKGAIANLTKSMAWNHGREGVRVNSILPGPIPTTSLQNIYKIDSIRKQFEDVVALGRWGDASEIAAVIAFLASPDASYVTGINMLADGGMTLSSHQPNWLPVLLPQAF